MQEKRCSLCGETKSFDEYHKQNGKTDGRRSHCKKCRLRGKNGPVDGHMPNGDDYSDFVGEGMGVKGKSTRYKKLPDGTIVETGGWIKTDRDKANELKQISEFVKGLFEDYKPAKKTTARRKVYADVLKLYAWGDPHIGMLAWERETGTKFDLEIVETLMVTAVEQMVAESEPVEEAILATVGDTYHTDNFSNTTPKSGNPLDSAGRYEQVLRLGGRIFRRCVDAILKKHKVCHLKIVPGNHDPGSTAALRMAMLLLYEREPRVLVDENPSSFQWHQYGKSLIGFNHGHRVKATELALTMAHDCPKLWAECPYRYIYTGHVHHLTVKEIHGVIIETLRTIAGRDGYHADGGYRSGREMRCDTFDKRWGRHTQTVRSVDQILAELGDTE